MRVMVIGRATKETEAQKHPLDLEGGAELFQAMEKYTAELMAAGIVLDGAGLKPSRFGCRIQIDGAEQTVIDGPFTESKELVAGFSIWQVSSLDEAVAWARRCPTAKPTEIEIRPLWEPEDFAPALAAEGSAPGASAGG